jgi:outer membrane protein assembly factor BamB
MWRHYLFMETHDNYLVKIDARTGKEVWHVEIAPFEQQYFSSMAPVIIGDHVIAGTATISTRRVTCSPSILKPANGSGSSTPCR